MKKFFIVTFIVCFFVTSVFAQTTSAGSFFQSVSDVYKDIKDYEASVRIRAGKSEMVGTMLFKRANLLRIDFSKPEQQAIIYDGDELTIYLPESNSVLTQRTSASKPGANLATPEGLTLMSRYYSIDYDSKGNLVPLEINSSEQVIKLLLTRKNVAEGFKTLKLSVNPSTKLIRRIEAVSTSNEMYIFDFTDYEINQGIDDKRFLYDAPSVLNKFNNFLYSE